MRVSAGGTALLVVLLLFVIVYQKAEADRLRDNGAPCRTSSTGVVISPIQ